jgi:hypothetical protein
VIARQCAVVESVTPAPLRRAFSLLLRLEARHARMDLMADFTDKHLEETYKALIPLSAAALKMALALNGATAIALLAFMREATGHPNLRRPILILVIGVALAAFAHAGAYITQLILFIESKLKRDGHHSVPWWAHHEWYLLLNIALVLLSIGAFCWGAISASHRIHP